MKLTLIARTRPNFIKIAPIISAFRKHTEFQLRLVHTGQHYDKNLSDSFFEDLQIPEPDVNLDVRSGTQAEQTANIMVAFEKDLINNPADYVLVVGDVNSTLACSIVAKKLNTKVIHVEAGLRSYDLEMPEEINRMVVDAITDVFFTTTPEASQILADQGVSPDKIHLVGNVMIDSLRKNLERLIKPDVLNEVNQKYFVLTLHRPSNVDDPSNLIKLLNSIGNSLTDAIAIFPTHPRTLKKLDGFTLSPNIKLVPPMRYLSFIYLIKNATGVITDSGGVQEESTYLGVPCLTLRENTERPETVTIGTNEIIGSDHRLLNESIEKVLSGKWKKGQIPQKWDGNTAERIVETMKSYNT